MQPLKQSTSATVLVGPVLDSTGAAYTGMAIGDFNITKNGTTAAMAATATATHSHEGHYLIAFTTGNTDTLGRLDVSCNKSTYAMPPFRGEVLAATAFDTLVTNGTLASTTSGRTIVVDAAGLADANMVKAGPTGSGTAQTARDIGGALPAAAAGASGGLLISGSNSGTTTLGALTVSGATTLTGAVSLGSTLTVTGTTSFAAMTITGTGSSSGLVITGGPTCTVTQGALRLVGGSTSGAGMSLETTDGHGLVITGTGSARHGVYITSGSTGVSNAIYAAVPGGSGFGIRATSMDVVSNVSVGGTTTLTGAVTATNASNSITGITVAAIGSDAITSTSLASSAGSEIAAAVWDLATSGHTNSGTFGEAMSAAGSAGDPWTISLPGAYSAGSAGYILGTNLDAAITSRMATYSQPTGFLAATFPTTVASTTNITAASGITVSTNNDKTGYSLTQSFPSNFSSLSITSAGLVATTSNIKKNQALSKFAFLMTDSTAHEPATGLTVTVSRSIDGGAFSSGALSSVTEIGSGMYYVDFSASDLNGNVILLKAVASGADTTLERVLTQP